MQAPAHLAISWFAAEGLGVDRPRDRRVLALGGLSPDVDAVVYPIALLWFDFDRNRAFSEVWTVVHHRYTHGIGFAVLVGLAACALSGGLGATHRARIAGLALLAVLIHVFCDLVAAGSTFPVYPWWPLSDAPWTTGWSWELREWPNQVITAGSLVAVLLYARLRGRSPLESLSVRLDAWLVRIVQQGSDAPAAASSHAPRVLGLDRSLLVRVAIWAALAAATAAIVLPVASDIF